MARLNRPLYLATPMDEQVLYRELARHYDKIYTKKDYQEDVDLLITLVDEHKGCEGNELLDIGCGTGNHVKLLMDRFSCMGIDDKEEMLEVAREKVPGATFVHADMTSFDLGKRFDVVCSLFGTIGYARTLEGLELTLGCIAHHLKEGGVVVIDPWYTKATFFTGHTMMTTYDGEDIKIARLGFSRVEGDISILELHYLIGESDVGVKYFRDCHEMGLFEVKDFLRLMEGAGLESRFLEGGFMEDKGAYLGIRK